MMQLLLLMLAISPTSSQCSDVVEDVHTEFQVSLSQPSEYTLLAVVAVLCGAALVAVVVALLPLVRIPPLFTRRSANSQQYQPAPKLFDRIEEFH